MKIAIRVLAGLNALFFFGLGMQWLFAPAAAAEGLGMPLLEGVAASTQIGDLGAFFIASAIMMGLGQRPGQSHWFYPPALLIGGAAIMRTLAALLGHAAFAPQLIVPEIVMVAILVAAAKLLVEDAAPASE